MSPRPLASRALPLVVGLLAATVFLASVVGADDYSERRKRGRCHCHQGQGSWDFLRSPLTPPEDTPHCGLLRASGSCRSRPRPKGVSADCWGSQKVPCFWKRHAFSWNIQCPLCLADTDCEPCQDLVPGRDEATKAKLAKRLAEERKVLGPDVVIAVSPHFYVVTSAHKKIKLTTRKGTKRLMTAHEVVHLYLQRAELAYADFMHWFGGDVNLH